VGFGPGSTEIHFVDWERERSEVQVDTVRFGGVLQHADNEYLAALVERGIPGLVAVLLVFVVPILTAAASTRVNASARALTAGFAATVAAMGVVALVDEPLTRPAELMLLWTAIPLLYSSLVTERR
jgi:O-antigen ligase